MKIKTLVLSVMLLLSANLFAQKQFTLQSPDKDITIKVNIGDNLTYSVTHNGTIVLAESAIAMKLDNGTVLGEKPILKSEKTIESTEKIAANFYKESPNQHSHY